MLGWPANARLEELHLLDALGAFHLLLRVQPRLRISRAQMFTFPSECEPMSATARDGEDANNMVADFPTVCHV